MCIHKNIQFSFVYIHGFVDVGHDAEVHFIHMLEHYLVKTCWILTEM